MVVNTPQGCFSCVSAEKWLTLCPFSSVLGFVEVQKQRVPMLLNKIWLKLILFVAMFGIASPCCHSLSFELDSIAQWGKFPRFCVNTYRWGDRFFNTYDSTYVKGSGKRFNVKLKGDSWFDSYNFRFDNGYKLDMFSSPSTTMGLYLTYMAVSVGYDMNIGKYFNGGQRARKRFNLQFNCSLFALEYYTSSNDIGTRITRMGHAGAMDRKDVDFMGINTSQWGVDLYYFFNHKNYSQAAAFYYSKIQVRSSGSFFAGLSFWGQKYDFDFSEIMNSEQAPQLPSSWGNNYIVKNKNYGVKFGYAYNWVFHRGWCMGTSVAPVIGLRDGYINNPSDVHTTFAMSSQVKMSLVYNYKTKWFFGGVARWDAGLAYDKEHTLLSGNLSLELSAGFRFDFWR